MPPPHFRTLQEMQAYRARWGGDDEGRERRQRNEPDVPTASYGDSFPSEVSCSAMPVWPTCVLHPKDCTCRRCIHMRLFPELQDERRARFHVVNSGFVECSLPTTIYTPVPTAPCSFYNPYYQKKWLDDGRGVTVCDAAPRVCRPSSCSPPFPSGWTGSNSPCVSSTIPEPPGPRRI